jgi:hypothetical protein
MTERPILFSAPMVCALLDGRKTQTRRLINIKPTGDILDFVKVGTDQSGRPVYEMKGKDGQQIYIPQGKHLQTPHYSPRFAIGDRLWVKETWSIPDAYLDGSKPDLVVYRATPWAVPGAWRPSIFMLRWASRLTLIVTDVRVERLQDISEADAFAEGIERIQFPERGDWGWPQRKYREIWENINGAGSWDKNPWVVAATFEVLKQNIDEVE